MRRSPDAPRIAASAALIILAASGCGGEAELTVSEGQELYDANCGTCHGDRLLGDGPMAASLPVQPPSLLEHLGHHPADQLRRIILTGLPPAMPPAPLSEEQVQLVVDYAWTLVPDSLVESLREMQRMAEMGTPMNMAADSAAPMPGMMDHGDHTMPPDTAR